MESTKKNEPSPIAKKNLFLVPEKWPAFNKNEMDIEIASHIELEVENQFEMGLVQDIVHDIDENIQEEVEINKPKNFSKKYFFKTFSSGKGAPTAWKNINKLGDIKNLEKNETLNEFVKILKTRWDYQNEDYPYFEVLFKYSEIVATEGKETFNAIVDISFEAMQQIIEDPSLSFDIDQLSPGFIAIPYLEVFSEDLDEFAQNKKRKEFYQQNTFVLHFDKDLARNIKPNYPEFLLTPVTPTHFFSTHAKQESNNFKMETKHQN